jgi:WD40 repeat protein
VFPFRFHWLLAVGIYLALAIAAQGKPPRDKIKPATAKPEQKKFDPYPDPLPEGAIARLGTLGFRKLRRDWECAVAYSPDGKLLASADGGLSVWSVETGQRLKQFSGSANSVVFSADGKLLASSGFSDLVIWDVAHRARLFDLDVQGTVHSISFSPDGEILASRTHFDGLILWVTKLGLELRRIALPGTRQGCVSFSPDGKILATGGDGVQLWDPTTGKQLRELQDSKDLTAALVFDPLGRFLAAAGTSVKVWEVKTGRMLHHLLDETSSTITCLAFSKDAKILYWGNSEGEITRWETTKRMNSRSQWKALGAISSVALSPDQKILASSGNAAAIQFWDTATGKVLRPDIAGHRREVSSVVFSNNGKCLYTGSRDGQIICWEVASGQALWSIDTDRSAAALALATDARSLIGADLGLSVWDASTGKKRWRSKAYGKGIPHPLLAIRCLAVSPDSKTLALGYRNFEVSLWNLEEKTSIRTLAPGQFVFTGGSIHGELDGISSADFSPDGRLLMTTDGPRGIRIWDIHSGQLLPNWQGNGEQTRSGIFLHDGKTLVTADGFGEVLFWDVSAGKQIRSIRQESGGNVAGYRAFLSPDGRLLACCAGDKIRLWEAITGIERGSFQGHGGAVNAIAFSPDGRIIASASTDTTALLWDVNSAARSSGIQTSTSQMDSLWQDLSNSDGRKVQRAIWRLANMPEKSLPLLRNRLHPVPSVSGERIAKLIADLDDDKFVIRKKAREDLSALAEGNETRLREALSKSSSPEVRRSLEQLLPHCHLAGTMDGLRDYRAIEILEHIGNNGAKQILQNLANGVPAAWRTQEARRALERLTKRTGVVSP